jgi:hypothetical protein
LDSVFGSISVNVSKIKNNTKELQIESIINKILQADEDVVLMIVSFNFQMMNTQKL